MKGTDFLKKYKVKIDFEENCIHLANRNVGDKIKRIQLN